MIKSLMVLTSLVLTNPLFSMDMNETSTIISEATEATEVLQSEFDILVNEVEVTAIEINATTINERIDINSTIPSQELNTTKSLSCKENNLSVPSPSNSMVEDNTSIEDNGCIAPEEGNTMRGLIIYKTRIKPYCNMNGEEFAKQYAQEDWDDIYYEKEFKKEVLKACPKIEKRYKNKWTPHLYQFALEYASDSDAIPEC